MKSVWKFCEMPQWTDLGVTKIVKRIHLIVFLSIFVPLKPKSANTQLIINY